MSWSSVADFWAMGGYAAYVWGAYGVTLAFMLAEPLLARRRHWRAVAAADSDTDTDTDSDLKEDS